jgi:hypothetical protein
MNNLYKYNYNCGILDNKNNQKIKYTKNMKNMEKNDYICIKLNKLNRKKKSYTIFYY